MNYKKTLLATGMAAAFGITVSTSAQAGVLATAILDISSFVVSVDNGSDVVGTPLTAGDFSLLSISNNADSAATLNATTGNDSLTGVSGPVDLGQVCVGSGCQPFVENDFTNPGAAQAPPTAQYSYADQNLVGAVIDGTPAGPAGANASTRADVSLINNATGSSSSNTGTGTALQFTLASGITDLDIDLDFSAFLEVFIDTTDQVPPSAADADISWDISVLNLSTGFELFSGSPAEINSNRSLTFPLGSSIVYNNSGSLHFDVGGFNSTDIFQLTVTHASEANATLQVSEPSTFSMALLGIGVLGAGVAVRRRKS